MSKQKDVSRFAIIAIVAMSWARVQASEADLMLPMGALAHAADALERKTGGRVLEIRLVDEKGEAAFECAVVVGDAVVYMRVASVTDEVTEIAVKELPEWLLNYKLQSYMRSTEQAQVPLVEAIMKAENRARAAAIGAGVAKPLRGDNAVLAYYVETLRGKRRGLEAVDAETGRSIANPEAVYEHWTPVRILRRQAP
jgi:hypothetical protein